MILLNIRVAILSYVPKSAVFLRDFYFCAKKVGRTGLQMWKDGLLPLIALKKVGFKKKSGEDEGEC